MMGIYGFLADQTMCLKVAGHRLGTVELESAFVSHKSIAEAAVTSKAHQKKGESIIVFLVPGQVSRNLMGCVENLLITLERK